MAEKAELDSSSSEDEICMEAIKEAANHDLSANLPSQFKAKENGTLNSTPVPDNFDFNEDQFSMNGLTQSCRDFIAKKLMEKLSRDIILEDVEIKSISERNSKKGNSQKSSGIKLLSCSNTILTRIIDDDSKEANIEIKQRKIKLQKFDEKKNVSRCKQVALDSQTILSQCDVKHWLNRKPGKVFKYKKSKTGVLLQME